MSDLLSLTKQVDILEQCIQENVKLSDVLQTQGYSYDDLKYRLNKRIKPVFTPFQKLDDFNYPFHGIPVVSFFSGAGGLDLGFEQAGYQHLASFEISELFGCTIEKNRPNWAVFSGSSGDLRHRETITSILRNEVGICEGFNGVFHGGPPCQPFSIAANQRFAKWGDNFKRVGFEHSENGNLLFDYIWQIKTFKPSVFLIENVPGLLTIDSGKQLAKAIESLQASGYKVAKPTVINARHYGVPQSRERLFIVGWRDQARQFLFPAEDILEVPCYVALQGVEALPNHVTRKHKAGSIRRYMELDYGKRDKLGRVDRLDPTLPAKTVIAGGTKGGGRSHLHPFVPRTLSPRESARLQTFPDAYEFCGSPARQLTQVGNAVPPLLGLKMARAIYNQQFA